MDRWRRNATLFQINAVTWAGRLAHERGEPATLFDVPDSELDRIAALGFDLVWLMGVWQRGPLAVHIALNNPHVPPELTPALPDWTADDVIGSPFAVQQYVVDAGLGGDAALASLRSRLAERGLGLILDFIPNHVARDHPWVFERPEFLVTRDPEWVERNPERFFLADTVRGPRAVAYGKDPHFVGWIDTAQLDYRNPALRNAMCDVLREVASRADGARCDMAMLVFDDVFSSTWPEAVADHPEPPNMPFWPAAIDAARSVHPQFLFIAEVYWAMEGRVLESGFDYAYDKAFYDRLKRRDVGAIQQAVRGPLPYLSRTVHFIENHDEEPAIAAFPGELTKWAATLSSTLPGLRFFHEGQFDGRSIRLPVQLGRPQTAHADPDLLAFYERLLHILTLPALRDGDFHVVDVQPEPATDAAGSPDETFWNVLAYHWHHDESGDVVLVVANLSGEPARATVPLASLPVAGRAVDVVDLLHSDQFPIAGNELIHDGLSVSLAPFVARVISFQVRDAAG